MSHYCCKICHQFPDECDCGVPGKVYETVYPSSQKVVKSKSDPTPKDAIAKVFAISDSITNAGYPRNPLAIYMKASEEMGELATELGVKYHGFYKQAGKDGIIGEAVDAINCLLDVIHVENPNLTVEELTALIVKKAMKWHSKVTGDDYES